MMVTDMAFEFGKALFKERLTRVDISRISLPEYLSFGGNPGIDGVFELIVAPKDFETAKELYDGWSWVNEAYDVIVTKVISAN